LIFEELNSFQRKQPEFSLMSVCLNKKKNTERKNTALPKTVIDLAALAIMLYIFYIISLKQYKIDEENLKDNWKTTSM
jgi:hypothetical protein